MKPHGMNLNLKKIGSKKIFWRQISDAADISSSVHFHSSGRSSTSNVSTPSAVDILAVEAAEETRNDFLSTVPPSLLGQAAAADDDEKHVVAPFKREELILGPKLGSGEFSHCYEITSFRLLTDAQDESKSKEELDMRLRMKQREKYRDTNNARYALKHLKDNYLEKHGPEDYVYAACDLAREAEFLASLDHPNIIKLRGITYSGAAGFADGPTGYFLILDRLQETLDTRIKRWRRNDLSNKGPVRGVTRSVSTKVKNGLKFVRKMSAIETTSEDDMEGGVKHSPYKAMDERLFIALQISAALLYMHSHSIIFRDLKPQNIGFDVRGDVKVFDFGLSRVMPEDGDNYSDYFEMSGAGSPRYMVPECLMGDAYNFKADTWTFGLVLWEMLTCELPYSAIKTRQQLVDMVVLHEERPRVNESWPSQIQSLLGSSFAADPDMRPKMKLCLNTIRDVLVDLRGGCADGLNDTYILRHRTLMSMHEMMKNIDKEKLYNDIGIETSTDC